MPINWLIVGKLGSDILTSWHLELADVWTIRLRYPGAAELYDAWTSGYPSAA